MNLKTRVRSTFMRHLASPAYLEKQRSKARRQREKQGQPPVVHYFHQVDDPYSHLAVQKLPLLADRYALPFQAHLVSEPAAPYQGSAEHFAHWARQDAAWIAADYDTHFAPSVDAPVAGNVATANQILAGHLDKPDFADAAFEVGNALWRNEPLTSTASNEHGERALAQGNDLRQTLGHYQGAMFYFDGEWFWGIDRIRLLEARLQAEGFDQQSGELCVPEPALPDAGETPASAVVLEYFPSLRSPYTAIGHSRVLELIERSGVSVQVRPVMPMMMRGIPAPRAKQRYIITDAAREGRAHGSPLGHIVDPFGEPVKRAFALFPAADAQGLGLTFVTNYLNAAWFDGVDITRQRGLQQVIEQTGLDLAAAQESTSDAWETILNDNLNTLTAANLWGVPSFRVSGGNQHDEYVCWGQDRIWRVAREIARRT